MMKTSDPVKAYDSIEYGILLPDAVVQSPRRRNNKRMSWPKCLCLTLLVLAAVFFLTTAVASIWGYVWMKRQVKRFTTTTPQTFPIHPLPDAELEIFKDRAKLFYDTLRAGQTPAEDLVVTQDELNGLIAHSDYLRGNAVVTLTENTLHADMSLPAKFLPGGKGRYFVGSGSLTMEPVEPEQTKITTTLETVYKIEGLEHPKLLMGEFLARVATAEDGTRTNILNLVSGQFYNWVAPPDYIAKKENLLEHICDEDDDEDDQDCRDLLTVLDGLEHVSIVKEKIIFHARDLGASPHRRLATTSGIIESTNLSEKVSFYGEYTRRSLMKMLA